MVRAPNLAPSRRGKGLKGLSNKPIHGKRPPPPPPPPPKKPD